MNVFYVTDNAGIEMLKVSAISLINTNPDVNIFVYFSQDIPILDFAYTPITLTNDVLKLVSSFPKMRRRDGRTAPFTTYTKIPALFSLPPSIDQILYLDIDTLVLGDLSDIYLQFTGPIGACSTYGSFKDSQSFNAGVMAFRRSLLDKSLLYDYCSGVMDSHGMYGDQEVLSRMKIEFELLSSHYNTKNISNRTKILHFNGPKPQERHKGVIGLFGSDFDNYWLDIPKTFNKSSEMLYMEKYNSTLFNKG